ncbi:MAG TPA: SpoIIE family protein phosphatase [Acidimicrobiales bacterium]|jgi:serine phosphatase RsbU (regulator of sigma subunit)/CHASE3 domain sensor protein|nr:SpoIIE family protein phosphatase [Acidimicrobiales bacterium]
MLLRRRVQLILAFLALLVGVDFVVDQMLVDERRSYRNEVRHRWEPARDATAALLFGLVDQETAGHAYLITGDAAFLDEYDRKGTETDSALDHVEVLIAGDPAIVEQLRRTRNRISAWRQLGASYEIEAMKAGRVSEATALVRAGTSGRLFDDARIEVDDLRVSIRSQIVDNERSIVRLERQSNALRVVSTAAVFLALALSGNLLRRWLTKPLTAVAAAARTVAAGDLDHPIPAPGPQELAALGRDVEAMRRRILEEVDEATRARDSLAQRGMIVLTLRDELAPSTVVPPPGLEIASRFRPSQSLVAGDWYDLRRTAPHELTFVVADVSGHGPAAGVFALKTKLLTGVALRRSLGPAAAWQWVADHLDETDEQYLTGVIATIDTAGHTLSYASAGHPPMLVVGHHRVERLGTTGPILGAFPGEWDEQTVRFDAGDRLLIYSDGLVEVRNDDGAWAELSDLEAIVAGAPSAQAIVDGALEFHDRYRGREHRDDVTIVAICAT